MYYKYIIKSLARAIKTSWKKYPLLERKDINEELIKKIAEIQASLDGWESVLAEHPATFDEGPLEDLASNINKIIEWHSTEPRILTHGDFHFENLLQDQDGRLIVCDWQGGRSSAHGSR